MFKKFFMILLFLITLNLEIHPMKNPDAELKSEKTEETNPQKKIPKLKTSCLTEINKLLTDTSLLDAQELPVWIQNILTSEDENKSIPNLDICDLIKSKLIKDNITVWWYCFADKARILSLGKTGTTIVRFTNDNKLVGILGYRDGNFEELILKIIDLETGELVIRTKENAKSYLEIEHLKAGAEELLNLTDILSISNNEKVYFIWWHQFGYFLSSPNDKIKLSFRIFQNTKLLEILDETTDLICNIAIENEFCPIITLNESQTIFSISSPFNNREQLKIYNLDVLLKSLKLKQLILVILLFNQYKNLGFAEICSNSAWNQILKSFDPDLQEQMFKKFNLRIRCNN